MSHPELTAKYLFETDVLLKDIDFVKYQTPASEEDVSITKAALEAKGHVVHVVESGEDAVSLLETLIPAGSTVSSGQSATANEAGITEWLKNATDRRNFKAEAIAKASAGDQAGYMEVLRNGYGADYFLLSASAVSKTGEIITADGTGTRVGGISGAKHPVFVIGTNKIVADFAAAEKRLYEFQLPVESARLRIVYKVPASAVNNVVTLHAGSPYHPGRVHVIIIKKVLGF